MTIMKVKDKNGNIVNIPLGVGGGSSESVYEYAKEAGYTGTEAEFATALVEISETNEKVKSLEDTTAKKDAEIDLLIGRNIYTEDIKFNDALADNSAVITIHSKNLFDSSKISDNYGVEYLGDLYSLMPEFKIGQPYTLSFETSSERIKGLYIEDEKGRYYWNNGETKIFSSEFIPQFKYNETVVAVCLNIEASGQEVPDNLTIPTNIQIEYGNKKTPFTSYISNFNESIIIKAFFNDGHGHSIERGYEHNANEPFIITYDSQVYRYTINATDYYEGAPEGMVMYCEHKVAPGLKQVIDKDKELETKISVLETYVYDNDDSVLGLEVDFVNNKFTRLCGASNLLPGENFDKFPMYGNRRRCNVDDDGNILCYYGDTKDTPNNFKFYAGNVNLKSAGNGKYSATLNTIFSIMGGMAMDVVPTFKLFADASTPVAVQPKPNTSVEITFDNVGGSPLPVQLTMGGAISEGKYYYTGNITITANKAANFTLRATGELWSTYDESGFHGQVMVYQPKFYYKVIPVSLGASGELSKVRYYVCDKGKPGFKLHPAFYDKDGKELDYILYSAYEGTQWNCLYGPVQDIPFINGDNPETAYGILDTNFDMLCSISGRQPISGMRTNLNISNFEKLAQNRGEGWHIETIQAISAQQLLMLIEYGQFNMQDGLDLGVTKINGYVDANEVIRNGSVITGATSELGNKSGSASLTTRITPGYYDGDLYEGNIREEFTWTGATSISYRGIENPWGNIFKFVNGISSDYREIYIDSQNTGMLFTSFGNDLGYIGSFAYSKDYDWVFIPATISGSDRLPVGDITHLAAGGYTTFHYGGIHYMDLACPGYSGPFCLRGIMDDNGNTLHSAEIGARLIYIPTSKEV